MLPFELTKDTPYLALSGELWSVFYEYFNRNWPCYKGFLLYYYLPFEISAKHLRFICRRMTRYLYAYTLDITNFFTINGHNMTHFVSQIADNTTVYLTACPGWQRTVYPKKYAHGFVVLCFVVVMQSFIMNSHEVFIHIHQGCFAGTGAIVRLPQCQWSKPVGYGKISQCITTTKHSKAKTVCIFLGI